MVDQQIRNTGQLDIADFSVQGKAWQVQLEDLTQKIKCKLGLNDVKVHCDLYKLR